MRAVSDVLLAHGSPNGAIDREGLEWMLQECLRAGSTDKLRLPGLPVDRQEIIPGGLAIMVEIFDMLGVDKLRVAEGALREGLLYDLLGRLTDEDSRVRSVRAMEGRFHVDVAQADRVEATALAFLRKVSDDWRLEDPLAEQILGWAARLHEVGLDISHSHYHHHGAYLLRNADMPGFPREEQLLLAALVGAHRRKLALEPLDDLIPPWHTRAEYLIVLLRLAVLLHRGRGPQSLPDVGLKAKGRSLTVSLTKRWLDDHPLTAADLAQEIDYLQAAGFKLRLD
jgi:exopolyphosphatase/guanosine-5'-triphosphate,3'-diphosphate pyrophosphatase